MMSYMFEGSNLSLYGYGFSDPTLLPISFGSSLPLLHHQFQETLIVILSIQLSSIIIAMTALLLFLLAWIGALPLLLGRDSVWPHDPHTGWSYCVTIPSWTIVPSSSGPNPATELKTEFWKIFCAGNHSWPRLSSQRIRDCHAEAISVATATNDKGQKDYAEFGHFPRRKF